MLSALAAAVFVWPGSEGPADIASRTLAQVEDRFRTEQGYRAWVSPEASAEEPAFVWDMAVLLSALAAGAHVGDPRAIEALRHADRAMDAYWSKDARGEGYAVLPGQSDPDRYYDDNAWIALAYLDAHRALPQAGFLAKALRAHAFAMAGESDALGGGVFWRERERTSKNACSNAPVALAALGLFAETGDPAHLAAADRLIAFTKRLQDEDGLVMDHLTLSGRVDGTKWTYNSALLLRALVHRYRLRHDPADLAEAKRIGVASRTKWLTASGAIQDEASFAHHMADAWLDLHALDPAGGWEALAVRATIEADRLGRMADGLCGLRWDRAEVRGGRRLLLYQGSLLRAAYRAIGVFGGEPPKTD